MLRQFESWKWLLQQTTRHGIAIFTNMAYFMQCDLCALYLKPPYGGLYCSLHLLIDFQCQFYASTKHVNIKLFQLSIKRRLCPTIQLAISDANPLLSIFFVLSFYGRHLVGVKQAMQLITYTGFNLRKSCMIGQNNWSQFAFYCRGLTRGIYACIVIKNMFIVKLFCARFHYIVVPTRLVLNDILLYTSFNIRKHLFSWELYKIIQILRSHSLSFIPYPTLSSEMCYKNICQCVTVDKIITEMLPCNNFHTFFCLLLFRLNSRVILLSTIHIINITKYIILWLKPFNSGTKNSKKAFTGLLHDVIKTL